MKIGDQVFRAVLDIGATLSLVALKTFKKTKIVALRVANGRTIQSLGVINGTICLGDETVTKHCRVLDTDAFDIGIGTDFLRRNPRVKMLSLQRPYSVHCDFGNGLLSVPLELSGRKSLGCATQPRLTIVLKTTNWPVTFLKMDWRPIRYPWMRSRWNSSRANNSTSCSCIARNIHRTLSVSSGKQWA